MYATYRLQHRKNGLRQNFCMRCNKQIMKALRYTWVVLFFLMVTLTSCDLVGDIFQLGMGVAIFIVVLVVALVIWLISRFRR